MDNLIEKKANSGLLMARPKTGKSMLATQLSLAVASGSVFF
ncbi:AAA family ATPase [Aeromonas media]